MGYRIQVWRAHMQSRSILRIHNKFLLFRNNGTESPPIRRPLLPIRKIELSTPPSKFGKCPCLYSIPLKGNSSILSERECSPEAIGGGRNSVKGAFERGKSETFCVRQRLERISPATAPASPRTGSPDFNGRVSFPPRQNDGFRL